MSAFIDLNNRLIQACLPDLLRDKTTQKNIVFATDSYAEYGRDYQADMEIFSDLLAVMDLKPRILKAYDEQALRTRKKAEVFTPAWLCCRMNNHCDDEWFERPDVFNHLEGQHWRVTTEPIRFPEKKNWKKYVDSRRLEITCGEAPYIVSRYDAAAGSAIPLPDRIGMLDRKLRIVNENTSNLEDWFQWTLRAFQSVYGYEWQGDSLLIARINLFMTFVEYYEARWGAIPEDKSFARMVSQIVNVIAWNFWQMDGLTGTVPHGALEEVPVEEPQQFMLFGLEEPAETKPAPEKRVKCQVRDWRTKEILTFNSLKKGY